MEGFVHGTRLNLEYFRRKLLEKQREYQIGLAGFEAEAKVAGTAEVRDFIDDATISQGTSEAFEEGTIVSRTLDDVQDALNRIETGSYGRCTLCGREIEGIRLEAIPWAALCMEDQAK